MTITLDQPSQILGFELEPNAFAPSTYTIDFYNGTTLIGSITHHFNGAYNAALFAIVSKPTIDRVEINGTPSFGFAIAQIRCAIESPFCIEPPSEPFLLQQPFLHHLKFKVYAHPN